MQILKRKSGITLVALIITIIILLILAGVSLSFVFNGGILDKSQQAVNEYENAANAENKLLDDINSYLENKLNEKGGGSGENNPTVPSVDENGLATENTTIVAKDNQNIQIVIPKGFAPVILESDRTDSLPGENGAVKEIMPVENWNNITVEQINKGIVVVDNAITYTGDIPDFNEYVWIPIADSSKFARVAWNGPYNAVSWQNGIHPLSDVSTGNAYWEETSSEEYTNMVNSVSINKGFYISRYEVSQKDSTTAQSKRRQNPFVNVSQTTAITVSSNMKKSINSHLIYGIEWDSVLQWLLDSEAKVSSETSKSIRTITEGDIQADSRSWGNYKNAMGDASINSGVEKPTGTSEYWKVNNIYDLAGNVSEWTQEKYSTNNSRTIRGAGYNNNGDSNPVASRGNDVDSGTDNGRRN